MSEGKLLSMTDIVEADDSNRERVPVPEWGGDVYVQGMTANQLDAYEVILTRATRDLANEKRPDQKIQFRAVVLAFCLVDGKGTPLFSRSEVTALGKKSGTVVDRLYRKAKALSGLTAVSNDALTKARQDLSEGQPDVS